MVDLVSEFTFVDFGSPYFLLSATLTYEKEDFRSE